MFSIDNEKPQALGALVRREVPKPAPKVVQLKPGLTSINGKLCFDPEKSASPPAAKPEGFDLWARGNNLAVTCEAQPMLATVSDVTLDTFTLHVGSGKTLSDVCTTVGIDGGAGDYVISTSSMLLRPPTHEMLEAIKRSVDAFIAMSPPVGRVFPTMAYAEARALVWRAWQADHATEEMTA